MQRVLAALLAAVCVTGPACGNDDDSAERRLLELRPVLAANPPPCPDKAAEKDRLVRPISTEDGKVAECLELGPPIVDAKDVRSATVADTPAGDPALSVVLGNVGSTNLDEFAQRSQGKRLAILTEGSVASAPVVRFTSFAGRIQVTGLSKEQAEDLFRRLNKVIQP